MSRIMKSPDAQENSQVHEDFQESGIRDSDTEGTPFKEAVVGEAPDGGLRAWLQVLCGHLIVFNVWGYINSYGIFESYYVTTLNRSSSDIAWVGSLEIFFVYFLGSFSGRATDAGYIRTTLAAGLFMQLLGVFMTSLATSYWQLLLSQGVCQGIGDGLLFCPIVALMSTYFTKKRTIAISISACGAATGGLVFPAIAQTLLHRIGFAWTIRVMGFVLLFNAGVILLCVRQRLPPRKSGSLIELKAFTDLSYTFFAIGTFFCFWAVYYAYDYVRSFGHDIIGVSDYTSFSILMIMNGLGLPGRLVPAFLSDRYTGPVNMFIPVSGFAAVLLYCWIAIKSYGGLVAFVVVYGFFGGGVQSLFPSALASLTDEPSKAGVRIGMIFSIVSIASLTGPPIAGALIDIHGGHYLYAQLFGGTSMVLGCLLLIVARYCKCGMKLYQRM
ncbi:Major facilitator superfamily domain, general substrate transporter [Penicillium italicum]|uniref:Major facilitator superfamily domain, general substrate transporter n=1 Tax=Penicillium italicum TaxID=40296 RepID=A0A0A2L6N5_PENIT|nr:Major facilitator superfamily domain, general substrate transporter [Penicillium italicum]